MLTYADCERMMATARGGRVKLKNNTYLYRSGDGFAVRLHDTDVVTIHNDGTYTLRHGGWPTVTTKARINAYAPVGVYQRDGSWYVSATVQPGSVGRTLPGRRPFVDGMRVDWCGVLVGEGAAV